MSDAAKARVAELLTRYPQKRSAVMPALFIAQHECGWLTDEAVHEAAGILELSALQVEELATFYEMIYRRPVGRHVIHVCDSISCWSMGGETLMDHFKTLLGIEAGATTNDGAFTLLPCCCLGNCGNAPAVMVAERQFGPVTLQQVETILADLRDTPA